MEIDTSLEVSAGRPSERCPSCGTPYPAGDASGGCPVCQFRRLLSPEAASDDEALFDHYELAWTKEGAFEELGHGAMGVTYKAFDTVLGHFVALKVMDARIASHPAARERFLREAQAAARIRHPNVASVFYYGVRKSDRKCFYAMELVEGETLEARLRRVGPLSPTVALEAVAQVSRALAAAEAQGLVHRDLKPSNLMLTDRGEFTVKVIDFGLAKTSAFADEPSGVSRPGFLGTPAFASPEQCSGIEVDIRSDLYALGVMLWEMVTGHEMFRGSASEIIHQHQHEALPFEQLEGVPQPIVLLLEMLLAKDPRQRCQSPVEVLKVIPMIADAVEAEQTITYQSLRKLLAGEFYAATRKSPARLDPEKISIARLPITGSDVFGREEDIGFLNDAWANPNVNVVTIVAWAGVGKSTLVNHWLRRMALQHYRSAEIVFGWSFYRQGSSGGTSSADEFLDASLAWFGDPNPRIGTQWEKGERLAKLVAHRRTLLILDGLEPLQNPPGPDEARLRDPALQALLREIAAFNTGLCVITTRLPIADIAQYEQTSAPRRDLEQLSSHAGAKLLRALGVRGSEDELRSASDEFSGHCLALKLLGSYLTDAFDGDVRCRAELSCRLADDVRQGAHARRVMKSYQAWFGEGPELSVLRILGLFDRPADEYALAALLKPPAVPNLTDQLTNLSATKWRTILTRLRSAGLLAGKDPSNRVLDAHPLVREYFGEQLRTQQREAWIECNRRLYDHYQGFAPPLPDNVREMEPLFLAVICGCHAGLFHRALHEVYIPRIQRGSASFTANILGARGALLSVLVHFFEQCDWSAPLQKDVDAEHLTQEDQLFILMQAGLYLTATRGHATREVRICYERAEPLCHSLNHPVDLFAALIGQWRHSLLTDKLATTMQLATRAYSTAREQDEVSLLTNAFRILAVTHYFSGNLKIARRYARRGVHLGREGRIRRRFEEVNSPVIVCLSFDALCGWHFGETASSRSTMERAVSLAQASNDTYASAVALFHAEFVAHFEADVAEVERLALELIELSTRQHFDQWRAAGRVFGGWARSACGNPAEGLTLIEEAMREWKAPGSTLVVPYWLALKAEALQFAGRLSEALAAVQEAEALAKASGELWWLAELYRLQGVFLSGLEATKDEVEKAFCRALRTAKQQKSISLAARTEASYAKFRLQASV